MTLCPNEIKTRLNCRLLNGFRSGQSSRNIFGRLSEIFGSRWDIFGNPVHDKTNMSRI